jgi:short chain dehydrogenase
VTGGSAGIGRTLAESALRRGHNVVATARRLADLSSLTESHGAAVFPLELDVNDEAADADTVAYAVETLGHFDVAVNNPGYDSSEGTRSATDPLELVKPTLPGRSGFHRQQSCVCEPQAKVRSSKYAETTTREVPQSGSKTRAHTRERGFSGHLAREATSCGVEVMVVYHGTSTPNASTPTPTTGTRSERSTPRA